MPLASLELNEMVNNNIIIASPDVEDMADCCFYHNMEPPGPRVIERR
jgi:hypothetical protein